MEHKNGAIVVTKPARETKSKVKPEGGVVSMRKQERGAKFPGELERKQQSLQGQA